MAPHARNIQSLSRSLHLAGYDKLCDGSGCDIRRAR
jgi:hypothetical protein